jgi:hypothetical protein
MKVVSAGVHVLQAGQKVTIYKDKEKSAQPAVPPSSATASAVAPTAIPAAK